MYGTKREVKEIHGGGMKRWWNEEVKEAVSRKEDAHKAMCKNSTEENRRHKIMKEKAKKAVLKAMREKAEEALTEL